MNWFRKHLHLTMELSTFIVFLFGGLLLLSNPPTWAMYAFVIVANIILMPIAAWILKEKKQSRWWLLALVFLWILIYQLENRSNDSDN